MANSNQDQAVGWNQMDGAVGEIYRLSPAGTSSLTIILTIIFILIILNIILIISAIVIIIGDMIFIIIIFPMLRPICHMFPIIIIPKHGISECGTSLKCGNT